MPIATMPPADTKDIATDVTGMTIYCKTSNSVEVKGPFLETRGVVVLTFVAAD